MMDDLSKNLDLLRQKRNKYIREHRWNQALETIEEMIRLLPTPSFYTRKGMIEIKLGRYAEGIDSLKQALHIEPSYIKARQILMKLSARMAKAGDDPLDNMMSNSQAMLIYSESVNSDTDSLETLDKTFTNPDGTLLLVPDSDELGQAISPPSDITNMSALPQQFGEYKDLRLIGSGSMGIVYRAYHPRLNKYFAIKVIHPENNVDHQALQKEAQMLSRLHHPNIVNIKEVGTSEGSHYIVMDYVKGETLSEYIQKGKYSYKDALQIIRFIALAIDYAHQSQIIHRDLKPSNIIIEQDTCLPIVMDFGLAANIHSLSKIQRSISGTPRYMAPEQAMGQTYKISPATDVYAIGAILYEMLTKTPVVTNNMPKKTLQEIVAHEAKRPTKIAKDLSPEIEAICMKCLYKDLRYRYFNARELADDITRYFDGEAVIAPRLTIYNRGIRRIRRSKKLFTILFLFVLGFCSMLASALLGYNSTAATLRKDLQTLHKSNYSKEDLLVKFPLGNSKKLPLVLQQQLEISIHNYLATIDLLKRLDSISPRKKNIKEIRQLNKQLLELAQFSPKKSFTYLYDQPANSFFKDDYDILLQHQKKDSEKDKRFVNDIMEQLRTSSNGYEKHLRDLIYARSSFVTAAMIGYANSSLPLQQRLALDYLITVDMKYGKQNIKEILLENLRNIEATPENKTKITQLVDALYKLRNK
ncbi:serine/threonine protein kinase [Candidatus Uabimicrobium amorphum]|uniref:Protein kinase n=1 Tax=Uabimicrobium amorphum TaxID=2596890 RepID=A0A5S9IIL5_UABAM|nr:serine/threonine-protein kinase [Candidatus Uabimicrobium amorphum]BBM82483.1 protein kinase [Candidatus Uabimicrobium amorphum]